MKKCRTWDMWRTRPVQRSVAAVARHYGIAPRWLRKAAGQYARLLQDVRRRQLTMWLSAELGASSEHIAYHLGGYERSTVNHHLQHFRRLIATDAELRALAEGLLAELRNSRDIPPEKLAPPGIIEVPAQAADNSVHRSTAP